MDNILLTNIQRFSLHDGPGIRTTVFLKGCAVRCPWCANPENLNYKIEQYNKEGQITSCGRFWTVDALYQEVIKDKAFYEGDWGAQDIERMPGGVTFSGGEALLQVEALEPLMKKLKAEKVHMVAETCLFVPTSYLQLAMRYIDFFYVDMKIMDGDKCKALIGGDLDLYHRNLSELLTANLPVVIRIPIIGGFTDGNDNCKKIIEILSAIRDKIRKIELIKEHSLGLKKYQALGYDPPQYVGVEDESLMNFAKNICEQVDVEVEICKV